MDLDFIHDFLCYPFLIKFSIINPKGKRFFFNENEYGHNVRKRNSVTWNTRFVPSINQKTVISLSPHLTPLYEVTSEWGGFKLSPNKSEIIVELMRK